MSDAPVPAQIGQLLLYQTEDGRSRIKVRLEQESVWLTQAALAELFQTTKQNISLHLRNIFHEGELRPEGVVKDSLTTAADGKNYRTKFYNLDAILAVGYRVRSPRGTQFRQWATARLREYVLPWLGTTPANWDVRRNGRLFAQRRETGFPDLPILDVSLRSGVRVRNFYTPTPPRTLAEIRVDIEALEAETDGLPRRVLEIGT